MVTTLPPRETDVAIVGGGPAGLAAAIAIQQEGLSVALFESRHPPVDKPCGEGLMPDGREALARLGVSLSSEEGFPFRGIRFTNGATNVKADFPNGTAIGVRRTILHSRLAARAEAAGVQLFWDVPVTGIDDGIIRCGSRETRCNWIIGADGHGSFVRRWAGLGACSREKLRFAYRCHYAVQPWSDYMELHWAAECQIYVTPVARTEVCVVVMSSDRTIRTADALRCVPELHSRLAAAPAPLMERGAITSTRTLRRVFRDRIALVGDASGSVDAITGEGLCLSFRHATAIAHALKTTNLRLYGEQHRALARRPMFMADFMLLLSNRSRLRGRAVTALSRRPQIFEKMLAMHVGVASIPVFAASVAELGWQMLQS